MSWNDKVFAYCERGTDAAFWAEPLNAVTNGAFLIAAIVAARRFAGLKRTGGTHSYPMNWLEWSVVGLITLVAIIGIGSFLFHTFATRWALLADVLPIMLFMLTYLAFALRVFLRANGLVVALALPAFYAAGTLASATRCMNAAGTLEPCFNGSLGYLPALATLLLIGTLAKWQAQTAARPLLLASGVFVASLTFRTLDRAWCSSTTVLGFEIGTHFLWHIFNAITLYLMLAAAIDEVARRRSSSRESPA